MPIGHHEILLAAGWEKIAFARYALNTEGGRVTAYFNVNNTAYALFLDGELLREKIDLGAVLFNAGMIHGTGVSVKAALKAKGGRKVA